MNRPTAIAAMPVLVAAVVAAGCGLGPGEATSGRATLSVTRDFGAEKLIDASEREVPGSQSVVRFLDAEADIETKYAGNFVSSIEGITGDSVDGHANDWFFFVNGYWSDIGAGEADVHPGDRIWWDFRNWSQAYRVPAVVGSWPEPFLHGHDGKRLPVRVECVDAAAACTQVDKRLRDAGVEAVDPAPAAAPASRGSLRILVGPWESIRDDPAAALIEHGPDTSGVYARPVRCGSGWGLSILGADAVPRQVQRRAGFVAAVRVGEDEPTWIVSGTDSSVTADAAALLSESSLADRYAVATTGADPIPIPAGDDLDPAPAGPGDAGTGCA